MGRSMMMKDGKVVLKKSVVGTRLQVFRGTKERTVGGLTKKDLMRNKHGKVVSQRVEHYGILCSEEGNQTVQSCAILLRLKQAQEFSRRYSNPVLLKTVVNSIWDFLLKPFYTHQAQAMHTLLALFMYTRCLNYLFHMHRCLCKKKK